MLLRAMFQRQRIILTLLVFVLILLFIRLGFWQLDRLEQRRALNEAILSRGQMPALESPPLDLQTEPEFLPYRQVIIEGQFDYEREIMLKLQKWKGDDHTALYDDPGSHILTPFLIKGQDVAILVDRGWIPEARAFAENLPQFRHRSGEQSVQGVLKRSQSLPAFSAGDRGTLSQARLEWTRPDLEAIQAQLPYPLLPLFLVENPEGGNEVLPFREALAYDLSEGSHLSYALQWFSFAIILACVYIALLRQLRLKQDVSN